MKCVLTVAGLGIRLLPLTQDLPKEMLPIYIKSKNQNLILKQILADNTRIMKNSKKTMNLTKNRHQQQNHAHDYHTIAAVRSAHS